MEIFSSTGRLGFARRVSRLRSTRTGVDGVWHWPILLVTLAQFSLSYTCPQRLPRESSGSLQRDRMDRPAVAAFGHSRAGDDRRGRPGSSSRTFAKQVRHVCASLRRVFDGGGDIGWRHQISARILIFNQRRRVRAQNAATPRRSSVPVYPGSQRLAGPKAHQPLPFVVRRD